MMSIYSDLFTVSNYTCFLSITVNPVETTHI